LGEAAQGLRSGSVGKRFEAKDWNQIFRQGWELFLNREQNDWKRQGSNTASFAYLKTGLEPFNPKPSSWQDAINTIGMSYTGRYGKYAKSYDVMLKNMDTFKDLSPLERKVLTEDYDSPSPIWNETELICIAARECGRRILFRWRKTYDEKSSALVNKEVLKKKVSSSVDCLVDDDHEELASLQKELESLHPSDFKASEAETIALKLVSFRLVETNNLEIAPPRLETLKQKEYLLTILNQTKLADSVRLIKHLGENGIISVTAVKSAQEQWDVSPSSNKSLTFNHIVGHSAKV
jgi:hypothetical protein